MLKIDWDDPVPYSIVQRWESFTQSLKDLEAVQIPLCFKSPDFGKTVRTEMHHFSDASTEGYGQCSYIKHVDDAGRVNCCLVYSKAKVAPLKQITIPRLELNAAVLSTRVSKMLKSSLKLDNVKEYFYADSQVILGYISNDAKRFHTFVANRIQEIHDESEPHQWHHVKTQENPADLASRGATAGQLTSSIWFKGPSFLWNQEYFHSHTSIEDVKETDPEVRRIVLSTRVAKPDPIVWLTSQYSSFHRLKGVCLKGQSS
jgi:hypothetical protein